MTAFGELVGAAIVGCLTDLPYRRSLAALRNQQVRDAALQSPVGQLALSWAAQYRPYCRIEERALRAVAVQGDLRAGRISVRDAELLAYGSDTPTTVSLDALSVRSAATVRPAFVGAATDPEATAARAIELLEEVLGPVVGLARPYVAPMWADVYAAPECRERFVRSKGQAALSGLSEYRVVAASNVWSRQVRAAPSRERDAARLLAIGTPTARGWLVLLANRDPLTSITSREAGIWGRLAWLSDPTAPASRHALEQARRDAQAHWRGCLERGLAHDDPYMAVRHALRVAA